ncbi:interferon regulatory factor 1-like [Argonauta hians]
MSRGRERLLDWLVKELDSSSVPGAEWVNRQDGIFRLVWIRSKASGCNENYFQIFKDWAIHTGRFVEGEKPKYPYWKSLFRNALNKQSNIKLISKNPDQEGETPCNVFQILGFEAEKSPELHVPRLDSPYDPGNSPVPTILNEYNPNVMEEEMETEEITHQENPTANFSVTVKIGTNIEKAEKINSSCIIMTGKYMDNSLNSPNILRLELDNLLQNPHGKKLVNGFERGIKIFMDNEMNIIANRSCQCRVFYLPQIENSECSRLERNKPVRIFDFKTFTEHLEKRLNGFTDIQPRPNAFLSIGQEYHLSDEILLSITIKNPFAEEYLKRFNFPNCDSIQMSNEDSIDRNNNAMKRFEEQLLKH